MKKTKNRIKEIRTEKKVSGTKIAKGIGISPQYFYDIEKSERNLSADLASKIADFLGVTVDYLLGKDMDSVHDLTFKYNQIEFRRNFLSNLKLLTDDEGYFFEDLRREIFNFIDKDIFFYFDREGLSKLGYSYEHFKEYFASPNSFTKYEQKETIDEFNIIFNYRTFKKIYDYFNYDEQDRVFNAIKDIIEKHELEVKKLPSNEKEFVNKLELSDDKLLDQFDLRLDGKKLTEDEARGIIAYLRSLRAIER